MGSKRRIVILTHAAQPFVQGYYLHRVAADHWGAAGHEILVHHGLDDPPDADLAILHVDATEVPADYRALARRYPNHVNSRTPSIARRRFSKILVDRYDAYTGPVMLKTDQNRYGIPDLTLYRHRVKRSWNPLTHLLWRYRRSVAWRMRRLPNDSYTIYDDKALVPGWAWRDRRFVVERFLPERAGEHYCVHFWSFLGDRDVVMTCRQPDPIVRPDDGNEDLVKIHRQVPEELRAMRSDLGLAFGKFDYVLDQGRPALVDVTMTPSSGDRSHLPSRRQLYASLAPGLDDLFRAKWQ